MINHPRTRALGLTGSLVCALLILQACSTVSTLAPKKAREAAQYNAQLGANYLQRGDLDQARDKLTKALKQDDSNALAHRTYGQLQHRVSRDTQARTHFNRAIELEPEVADHRNAYGIFLCQVDEFDEAREEFRLAAENPYYKTPEFALDNAGLCMLDADRLSEADAYLREALRVNPQFPNAYLHMAELQFRYQKLTVADAYYQRYLAKSEQTAESLYLGLRIKRDAGDLQTAERYAGQLLNDFPASSEAGEYLSRPIQ